MMGVRRSEEEVEEIKRKVTLYLSEGVGRTFYGACQSAGVGISEAYTWRDEDSKFEQAVKSARRMGRESAKDIAESIIMGALNNKSVKTAKWFLTMTGKDRDYSQRTELTGKGGSALHPTNPAPPAATDEEALGVWSEDARAAPENV